MTPLEPIEELARLLSDEKRLDEEIRATQAVLSRIKKKISESLVHHYINRTEGADPIEEDLMKREQANDRLLQALLEMKNEIQTRSRPIEEQIVQANIESIKELFAQQVNGLDDCLTAIDKKILDCLLHLQDYKRIHLELTTLNERLSRLSEEPLSIPNSIPIQDFWETIKQRIEHLKIRGLL